MIGAEFNRLGECLSLHHNRSCGGGFGTLLVYINKSLVNYKTDIQFLCAIHAGEIGFIPESVGHSERD